MRPLIAVALALCTLSCLGEPAKPRLALVYSGFGDNRHRDDYDDRLPQLGWTVTKVKNTDLAAFTAKLDDYDVVLGSALFNYGDPQDLAQYKDAWLKFVRRGGALILTDCNYPTHVHWLEAVFGPDCTVSTQTCATTSTPVTMVQPDHPVFTTPHVISGLGAMWAHMTVGSGWQVLAKCAEGGASWALHEEGRGFVLVTSHWRYEVPQLENLWAYAQFHRAGLLVNLPDLSRCRIGDNRLTAKLQGLTDEPRSSTLVVRVTRPDGTQAESKSAAQVKPKATADVPLKLTLDQRGTYSLSAALLDAAGAQVYETSPAKVRIPDLAEFTVPSAAYRDAVYLAARPDSIRLAISVTPFKESLASLQLTATLQQGNAIVAQDKVASLTHSAFTLSLPAGKLTGDSARIVVRVNRGARELASASRTLKLIPPASPQVFLDDTGACRIDGKLFFPIGIYHVPAEALPKLKEMRFNACQAWGTKLEDARAFLDEARKYDIHVLLEMGSHVTEKPDIEGFRSMVLALHDHPALLTWYSRDEPSGAMIGPCQQAYEMVAATDANHPVYLVMCSPGEFDTFGKVTDILAIDPYPIASAPVNMVAAWMQRAQDAVQGRRPIWLIPQLHNWDAYTDPKKGRAPTAAEERCMVYQGLVYGAKGIIYYPWDDGPTGLTHEPQLMAELPKINAELEVLGPKLLACERALTKADTDSEDLHAALFRGKTESFFIVTSGKSTPCATTFRLPGVKEASLLYGTDPGTLRTGVLSEKLEPFQVKVYTLRY